MNEHNNADRIKALRAAIGATQTEAARMFRVALRTLQGWEANETEMLGPATLVLECWERDTRRAARRLEAVRSGKGKGNGGQP